MSQMIVYPTSKTWGYLHALCMPSRSWSVGTALCKYCYLVHEMELMLGFVSTPAECIQCLVENLPRHSAVVRLCTSHQFMSFFTLAAPSWHPFSAVAPSVQILVPVIHQS